jgi:predicted Rossmann fold nucleotide-binding protein DprA/Smf involved in DNA uptake
MNAEPQVEESPLAFLERRLATLDEEREKVTDSIAIFNGKAPKSRRPKPKALPAGPKKARRKRRGGKRADQAVALIEKKPGISASDIAKAMKIKPNYLYRVLGDLEKEGRVDKNGRNYSPPAK